MILMRPHRYCEHQTDEKVVEPLSEFFYGLEMRAYLLRTYYFHHISNDVISM